jgi:hypothetical protein
MKRILLIVLLIVAVAVGARILLKGMPAPVATPTPLADDMIVLYEPLPEQRDITSPLTVRGKARGSWFFEASFPVVLTDWDGRIIAQTAAQAKGDWMTSEFVEFEATLTFESPTATNSADYAKRGTLILQKDNPSGLPENDDSREITIFFK